MNIGQRIGLVLTGAAIMFLGWAIIATVIATHPAGANSPKSDATECEDWAYNEGEDNYPDSILMHTIGCDNDGTVGSNYVRDEGRCAEIARNTYRNGIVHFEDVAAWSQHMRSYDCRWFEDGTYNDIRTGRWWYPLQETA